MIKLLNTLLLALINIKMIIIYLFILTELFLYFIWSNKVNLLLIKCHLHRINSLIQRKKTLLIQLQ